LREHPVGSPALVALILALANPVVEREERETLDECGQHCDRSERKPKAWTDGAEQNRKQLWKLLKNGLVALDQR